MHVNSDVECALDVRILAVSRFHVEVIQLDTAVNYHSNIIDNNVCESWTFATDSFEDFWGIDDNKVYLATELHYCPTTGPDVKAATEEKKWFQLYWHWVSFVRRLPDLMIPNHRMQTIMSVLYTELASYHQQQSEQVSHHVKSILEYLLFEQDALTCQDCIMSYLKKRPALIQAYQDWSRCR